MSELSTEEYAKSLDLTVEQLFTELDGLQLEDDSPEVTARIEAALGKR